MNKKIVEVLLGLMFMINFCFASDTIKFGEFQTVTTDVEDFQVIDLNKDGNLDFVVLDTSNTVRYSLQENSLSNYCDAASEVENCQEYNGHYYGITKSEMTWEEAKTLAESYNGHLVVVDDSDENLFLYNSIKSMFGVSGLGPWIGYSDISSEGSWKWINDSTSTYTKWNSNEPNGGSHENCGHYENPSVTSDEWNDTICSNSLKAIIEWE